MTAMDRSSGTALTGEAADIRQSICDILTTPIGSRVMRRSYGSRLFDLVDAPGTKVGALRLVAAAADAIDLWEPRVRVTAATVTTRSDGSAVLRVFGSYASGSLEAEVPLALGVGS
ncbi:GPW/gp25 family protein [Pararhodospirillum photometricum]|uniref:GPW/gp25 family protein n=1 Tax=Pararhodospirillum photometricum TaxID=1084 RepID=UPI0005A24078|nr:GPW/gp25 family protein [Pararhodospirillum photometricum]